MSEIRLVRCPKCSKVLPEPKECPVYQCGACGAVLRAKKSAVNDGVSENLVNCDKEREKEGGRSPARSSIGDGVGRQSPMGESGLPEFMGVLPKSPMRERFLSDLATAPNSPVRSRNVSRSPLRDRGSGDGDFDFNGVDESPGRSRNVSKSPVRERGADAPVSVRSRHVSRSSVREERTSADFDGNGFSKSPARSMNGDIPKSPMRRDDVLAVDNSPKEEGPVDGHFGADEEASGKKITPKTSSFSAWLSDEKHTGQSDDKYSSRRRRTWRDSVKVDHISEGRESVYSDDHRTAPEGLADNLSHITDPSEERRRRDMRLRGGYVGGLANSGEDLDQRVTGRDVHGNSKVVNDRGRMSASSSTAERPPYYGPNTTYGYDDLRYSFDSLKEPARLQDLERERAELLRKYKELKDQLSGLEDKRIYSTGFDGSSEDESWQFRRESDQKFAMDRRVQRPHYFNHGPRPVRHMEDMYSSCAPLYDDPISGQMTRGPLPRKHFKVQRHPIPGYVPGRSSDFDHNPLESYHDDTLYHHPACSCSLCYVNDWQGPNISNPLASRMSANSAATHRSVRSMELSRHGPSAYNPRLSQTTLKERSPHTVHQRPRRDAVTNLNKRLCHPISGGAPFISCRNCFRLLKMPQKFMAIHKNQHQLQCGACSAVMSFDLDQKSFGLLSSQKKLDYSHAATGYDEALKVPGPKNLHNSFAATSTNVGSCDFDAVGYSFQAVAPETGEVLKGQSSCSAENTRLLSPTSSHSSSKEEHNSDSASVRSSLSNSAETPSKINLVRPPPGSPLRDHFDYSNCFRRIDAGGRSYSPEEKQVMGRDTSGESSLETTGRTTETEVHSNEVPAIGCSQESADISRKEDSAGNNKDKQSSLTSFMKWGFGSKPGSGSPGKAEVCVNSQPIPHRLVKKAEKLAGPIKPGEYWYDSKAGFWGVMGHRCLGIVSPFIQEFSFPMPIDCSGGDTAVYINGRELHQRDLKLLASRGLPTTANKSYIVDMSGKVLDEETKDFVVNLGKLAPTVEKNKRGFGMQVPENLDD